MITCVTAMSFDDTLDFSGASLPATEAPGTSLRLRESDVERYRTQ